MAMATSEPDLWLVEYSPDQRCYHVDHASSICGANLSSMMGEGPPMDGLSRWLLLGVFRSSAAAHEFADAVRAARGRP
jgi:hypothetical protein